jgi:pyruvate/2-oxoglutarate dehydrogenase complex dihydrolipoamide acyltransferase (E2) component
MSWINLYIRCAGSGVIIAKRLSLLVLALGSLMATPSLAQQERRLEGTIENVQISRQISSFGGLWARFTVDISYVVRIATLTGAATINCATSVSDIRGSVETRGQFGRKFRDHTDEAMPAAVAPTALDLLVIMPDPVFYNERLAIRCQGGLPARYGAPISDAFNVTSAPHPDRLYCRGPSLPGSIPARLGADWCEAIGGDPMSAEEARRIHRLLLAGEIPFFDALRTVVVGAYDFSWSAVHQLFPPPEPEAPAEALQEETERPAPAADERATRLQSMLDRVGGSGGAASAPVSAPNTTAVQDPVSAALARAETERTRRALRAELDAIGPARTEAQQALAAARSACDASRPAPPRLRQACEFGGGCLTLLMTVCHTDECRARAEANRARNEAIRRERAREAERLAREWNETERARHAEQTATWERSTRPQCLAAADSAHRDRMRRLAASEADLRRQLAAID